MKHTEYNAEEVTTIEPHRPTHVIRTTKHVVEPPIVIEHPQRVYEKKKTIFRFYQVVWYILGIIEVFLGFRFVLKAIGANPFSGFTTFIYAISEPLVLPFQGILRTNVTGVYVIEWSTLVAAVVYAVLAYGIVELFQLVKPVTPEEVEETVDEV